MAFSHFISPTFCSSSIPRVDLPRKEEQWTFFEGKELGWQQDPDFVSAVGVCLSRGHAAFLGLAFVRHSEVLRNLMIHMNARPEGTGYII